MSFDRHYPESGGIVRALAARPPLPLAQASNFWPPVAWLYEPLWRRRSMRLLTGGQLSTQQELAAMLQALAVKPGELVLDAGCSAGLYARSLKAQQPEAEVHALDFSLPFLRRAQATAARAGLKLVLVEADLSQLPYRDASFNAIACGGTPNELVALEPTLSELARVLAPGGRLWLMYVAPAERRGGRALQRVLARLGLRFIAPAALEQQAAVLGLSCSWRARYGVVALELYRKTG